MSDEDKAGNRSEDLPEGFDDYGGLVSPHEGLISHRLLDDGDDADGALTPSGNGLGTPSEPGTPGQHQQLGMRGSQTLSWMQQAYDNWADAPAFVPGGHGFQNDCGAGCGMASSGSTYGAARSSGATPTLGPSVRSPVLAPHDSPSLGPSIWSPTVNMVAAQSQGWSALPGAGAHGNFLSADTLEMQHLRIQYEWQVQQQDEEMLQLQSVLESLHSRRAELEANWDAERKSLSGELARHKALLKRYAIPPNEVEALLSETAEEELLLEEAAQAQQQWHWQSQGHPWEGDRGHPQTSDVVVTDDNSSLNAKLRRLNGLLTEGSQNDPWKTRSKADSLPGGAGASGAGSSGDGMNGTTIASTLQAMFPHATVRTQPEDQEFEQQDQTTSSAPDNLVRKDEAPADPQRSSSSAGAAKDAWQ
eukprot:CAMPEP_0115141168 /NCGR_PEP_ID=MMETSP0227-20121206/59382_1 /TAXON_ID=89957 /ORGANISM="Polarella glacialis, Strain CCMP 1383" /LENGTH=417 /DNA_ID=CAMNT_0002549489 /DNA_START=1 /DNA_END=1252 /DNA_ORIENTATION=-